MLGAAALRLNGFEGICNTWQVAKHCLGDHGAQNVPLTVPIGKQNTDTVHMSLKATRHLIKKKEGKIPDMEETETLDDSPSAQEEDEEMSTQLLTELPSRRNIRSSQKQKERETLRPHMMRKILTSAQVLVMSFMRTISALFRVRFVVNAAYDRAHQASVTLNTVINTWCARHHPPALCVSPLSRPSK